MRLSIDQQRHILRHITQTSLSNRKIAKLCGVCANTVREMRARIAQSQQSWEILVTLPDQELRVQLGTNYRSSPSGKALPDWARVQEELQQRDMTLSLLHAEYLVQLAEQPQLALCYSHFAASYRDWTKTQRVSMRQFHQPGEKLFIDFCGRTMPVTDQETGETTRMQIFVAVLGASGYAFVYAVPSQKIADWLECHSRAFDFFGGVPAQLIPDNLKSAVTKHTREQLILNRCYMELADHYQCVINPARSRKPKDKSLAEVTVQIVQRWVLAPLRHRRFFSRDELNAAIAERVGWLNGKTSKKYPSSRAERFAQLDQPALRPLPLEPYEHSRWRYKVRVPNDYHVEYEGSHYSVPHQYMQHLVDVRATRSTLEVLLAGQRIASHALRTTPGVSTLDEHRLAGHLQQAHDEPEQLLAWAGQHGSQVQEWVQRNLQQRRDYANGLKSVRKLRHWVREQQNADRLDSACAFALRFNHLGFAQLKSIIERNADRLLQPDNTAWLKTHANIRGADYYRMQQTEAQSC
ncbi:IS21 family transposase [Chitinibacteraceae bacterium HSL-7]